MNMQAIDYAIHEAALADLAHLRERSSRSYRVADEKTEKASPDPNKGWIHETIYTFVDGNTVTLNGKSTSDIIFPATPGCELLMFERPEKGTPDTYDIAGHILREPIIGWRIEHDNYGNRLDLVTTITPRNTVSDFLEGIFQAVALQDGRVAWRSSGRSYGEVPGTADSFEQWIEQARQLWTNQLEYKAEEERQRLEDRKPCSHCGRGGIDAEIPF